MAHSHSTATPEATKTSAIAHRPVPDVQKASELETDRSGMLEARAIQAIGGRSPETSPEQYAGALGHLSGRSQTSLLRQLQRSYGNSYVGSVIQAKLTVNQPGDIYEQEADRMAAQVVMPKPELPITPVASVSQPLEEMGIQRQCSECQQGMEEGKDSDEMSSGAGIQRQLTVGAVGDRYEQEADRVAAQVMRMSVAPDNSPQMQRFGEEDNPVQRWSLAQSITPVVQRQVDEQVQMRELVQRAFQAGGNQASGDLESRLNASKGGGSALAPEVRAFMEPRFGADFSAVRVHTGGEAVQMNRELGAQAFTHGSDVYFGVGKSPGNNELTAHELTHVVQQMGGVQRQLSMGQPEVTSADGQTIQRQFDEAVNQQYMQLLELEPLSQSSEQEIASGTEDDLMLSRKESQTQTSFGELTQQLMTLSTPEMIAQGKWSDCLAEKANLVAAVAALVAAAGVTIAAIVAPEPTTITKWMALGLAAGVISAIAWVINGIIALRSCLETDADANRREIEQLRQRQEQLERTMEELKRRLNQSSDSGSTNPKGR
jgi:hypothetical protein